MWNSSNSISFGNAYGSFQKGALGKIDIDFSDAGLAELSKMLNREVSDQDNLNLSLSESSDFHLKIDGHDLSIDLPASHDLTADFGVLQIRHDGSINFDLSASAIFEMATIPSSSSLDWEADWGKVSWSPVNGFTFDLDPKMFTNALSKLSVDWGVDGNKFNLDASIENKISVNDFTVSHSKVVEFGWEVDGNKFNLDAIKEDKISVNVGDDFSIDWTTGSWFEVESDFSDDGYITAHFRSDAGSIGDIECKIENVNVEFGLGGADLIIEADWNFDPTAPIMGDFKFQRIDTNSITVSVGNDVEIHFETTEDPGLKILESLREIFAGDPSEKPVDKVSKFAIKLGDNYTVSPTSKFQMKDLP